MKKTRKARTPKRSPMRRPRVKKNGTLGLTNPPDLASRVNITIQNGIIALCFVDDGPNASRTKAGVRAATLTMTTMQATKLAEALTNTVKAAAITQPTAPHPWSASAQSAYDADDDDDD